MIHRSPSWQPTGSQTGSSLTSTTSATNRKRKPPHHNSSSQLQHSYQSTTDEDPRQQPTRSTTTLNSKNKSSSRCSRDTQDSTRRRQVSTTMRFNDLSPLINQANFTFRKANDLQEHWSKLKSNEVSDQICLFCSLPCAAALDIRCLSFVYLTLESMSDFFSSCALMEKSLDIA